MFKNVIVYRIAPAWSATLEQVEESLARAAFVECSATQEKSVGWVPPRGEAHGAFAESVDGQWILKLMIEAKAVPGSVLNRRVKERLAQIEAAEGRKPGKKETREIKEDAKLALLPMAFSKQASVAVWIDPAARLLVIDAASQAKADEAVTCLVKSIEGMAVTQLQTTSSAAAAMSAWLTSGEPPVGFSVDRECELKASDESQAAVKYSKHPLDIDEVRQHIAAGKLPTRLAMTWDDRVSFLLTESLQLKKLAFLDGVFDGAAARDDDGFDADVAMATGEMSPLIAQLLEALGGEVVLG